jgi:hypothetical protein
MTQCAWCEIERSSTRRLEPGAPRECPACDHVFRGAGWDGIDAHWKAKHDSSDRPYEHFWAGIRGCARHHGRRTESPTALKDVLAYVASRDRICPMPQRWNELYEMLPEKRRVGAGWEPPPPLILAAWYETPALMKIARLQEHLRYAAAHGVLEKVDEFLRALPETEWAHAGEI